MSEKLRIPESVEDLRMSPKKFAKKNDMILPCKSMTKGEKKHYQKRIEQEYADMAIYGLDKAVKIMAEHPDAKKIDKVKDGVENIITNPGVMNRITKLYKEDPILYPNLIYLPWMIMNTLVYYQSENLSDEEKEIGESLDNDSLVEFCEKILKKQIKRYKSFGIPDAQAFQLACVIPTTKLFTSRVWYRRLIQSLYEMAEKDQVDVDLILQAVSKIDKDDGIKRKDFLEGFFGEFMMQKASNKNAKFTDTQKDLHETLIDRTLVFADNLKPRRLKELLKSYINRRRKAEEYRNDGKRVIKWIDHANSNSPYVNIKQVVTELIEDNSTNELYLG